MKKLRIAKKRRMLKCLREMIYGLAGFNAILRCKTSALTDENNLAVSIEPYNPSVTIPDAIASADTAIKGEPGFVYDLSKSCSFGNN